MKEGRKLHIGKTSNGDLFEKKRAEKMLSPCISLKSVDKKERIK